MCTRSYPECSAYSEGRGAEAECDMDSSNENTNISDALDTSQNNRWMLTTTGSELCVQPSHVKANQNDSSEMR